MDLDIIISFLSFEKSKPTIGRSKHCRSSVAFWSVWWCQQTSRLTHRRFFDDVFDWQKKWSDLGVVRVLLCLRPCLGIWLLSLQWWTDRLQGRVQVDSTLLLLMSKISDSKWFLVEFGKNLSFPSGSSVFDVWIDPNTQEFTSWNERFFRILLFLTSWFIQGFQSLTWTRTFLFKRALSTTPKRSEWSSSSISWSRASFLWCWLGSPAQVVD